MSAPSPAGFDAYLEWLGIPPQERPADHYRLLGLPRFESDPERIEAAADERMSIVRRHQTGPRGVVTQPLLNELAAARNCLMNAHSKRLYDEQLRQSAAAPMARIVSPPGGHASPPPAPVAPSRSVDAGADDESPADDSTGDPLRSLLTAPAVLFFAMTAAVVVIAGGTFALGRYWFRGPQDKPAPLSAHRPAIESSEKNPEDAAPLSPPRRKRPAAAQGTVTVMQEGSGSVHLTPATAALSGGVKLRPTATGELLAGWSEPGDEAAWSIQIVEPGFFELALTYAALDEAGEAQITLILDDEQLKPLSLQPTGAPDKWSTRRQIVAIKAAGAHRLRVCLEKAVSADSLSVREVVLSPPAAADDATK